jgi:dihydropyrimidinase
MATLLKNGVVVSAKGRRQLDVRIENEKIIEMGTDLPINGAYVEDVTGCFFTTRFYRCAYAFGIETTAKEP